jgi:hypothetical protein
MEAHPMFKSKCFRSPFIVGLLIILTVSTGLQAVSVVRPSDDPLLKILPDESLFCIRVNHFEHTIGQVDQFLVGISPMPMGLSLLARMQIAKVLGSPELNGVNMNGSLAVFGAIMPSGQTSNKQLSDIFIGGLVPITDYEKFINGNINCGKPDDKGISRILDNGAPILVVTKINNYALVSTNYNNLLSMAKTMSSGTNKLSSSIDIAEAKLSMLEPVWLFGNIRQVSKSFEPMITGKIGEMKTIMKNTGPDSPNAPPESMTKFAQNTMNMYAEILQKLMKETKYFSITINPKANALNITKTISAVPGTDMAKMFISNSSSNQNNNLLHHLRDDAVMNFGFKLNSNFWKESNLKTFDFAKIMAGDNVNTEDIEKIKALMKDGFDCLNGPMVCTMPAESENRSPFIANYVMTVKDQKKYNRLIDEAIQFFENSSITDFYKDMGLKTELKIQRGVDTYKNVSIDSAKFTMELMDDSQQGQLINKMYGDGFNYKWGLVDGLCVLVIGGDTDSSIRELIDQVKERKTQMSSEIRTAMALLPEAEKADFMITYNLLRWFKMVGSTPAMPMLAPLAQMDIPTKSNIILAGKARNGKLVIDIVLPKEHLTEIMTAFMMMQQKMKMMMQQPPGNSGNQMN